MSALIDITEYRDDILNIWNEYIPILPELTEFEHRKHPLAPESVKKNNLLFIGINPSFGKGATIQEFEKPIFFYPIQKHNDDKKDLPYFQKFKEVGEYCNCNWTHLDLFFLRETNQKVIEGLMKKRPGIDFLNRLYTKST